MTRSERRPAVPADREFLWELHRATFREPVEKTWGWDDDEQRRIFEDHVDVERTEILLLDDRPVGCLRVQDEEDAVFLEYIAITPTAQNQGLGTEIVHGVMERARARGVCARLRVLRANRARSLYERLGFQVVAEDEVRFYMETPDPT